MKNSFIIYKKLFPIRNQTRPRAALDLSKEEKAEATPDTKKLSQTICR